MGNNQKAAFFGVAPVDPVVKWAGGKRKLAHHLVSEYMTGTGPGSKFLRYFEPFAGGLAVYLTARAALGEFPAVLSDRCAQLVRAYRTIRFEATLVAAECKVVADEFAAARRPEVRYYELRREYNNIRSVDANDHSVRATLREAALFLFLNRACYNGLWRVNKASEFNTPYGGKLGAMPDFDRLGNFGRALEGAQLVHSDYGDVLAIARTGDLVYLDPPYDGGYTGYCSGGFGWGEQVLLAERARSAAQRGARVIASNRATKRIGDLWTDCGFAVEFVDVRHSVGATGARRGNVGEAIFSWGET